MESAVSLLLVSPIEEDRTLLRAIFGRPDWKLYESTGVTEAVPLLKKERIAVVISERDLGVGSWQDLLEVFHRLPDPPYLIVSSRHADNLLWAEVLNLGGYDVVRSPFQTSEVLRVVRLAWQRWQRDHARRTTSEAVLRAAG